MSVFINKDEINSAKENLKNNLSNERISNYLTDLSEEKQIPTDLLKLREVVAHARNVLADMPQFESAPDINAKVKEWYQTMDEMITDIDVVYLSYEEKDINKYDEPELEEEEDHDN